MDRIVVFDLEVENHPYYGALASPVHPDNFVVASAWATLDGEVQSVYRPNKQDAKDWAKFLDLATPGGILVAHNAPFDVQWLLVHQRDRFMRFLESGGRVFCTAYAEYLLSNQQDTYPSLDSTAPKYGGSHKVDGVKIMWEQGKLTSEIDPALLLEYLAGPDGDVENTRKVFIGQMQELQERGMLDMALERMEGMLFVCLSMQSGLCIDPEVAEKQRREIEQELQALTEKFKALRNLPSEIEFKDTSDYCMSAWLYGGPIKYRVQDVWLEEDGTPKYEKREAYLLADGGAVFLEEVQGMSIEEIEAKHGPLVRYRAGKNKGLPKVEKVASSTPKLRWYERQLVLPGCVPLSKLPKEVREEFVQRFSGKRLLADGSPVLSTGADALQFLLARPEFSDETKELLQDLLRYAKLDKDRGTYYLKEEQDEDGNVVKRSGMLQYCTEHNIVYHQLNCTSTVTGRLSSRQPNLQNIPRGDTSDVKRMFVSRFNNPVWLRYAMQHGIIPQDLAQQCLDALERGEPQGRLLEADYSNLEVVTLAALSKDEALCKALVQGIDMHCLRLSKKLGEPYEEVLKKCKDETHPEHKRYKKMRTDIKPMSFAYQYGASAQGIAFSTGCSVEEAQAFIDAEKALFPGVEEWYEREIFAKVEASKKLYREMDEEGRWRVYARGVWQSPGGTCYEFREYPKTEWVDGQKISVMQFKPTQLRNYPIQGESGFFVQAVSGAIVRWLVQKRFFGGRVFCINQVHDAVYFDVHTSVLKEVANAVQYIMESLPQMMRRLGYDLAVPFPAAVEVGLNLLEKEHFHA
jgi:DNA polymerase I-like protein with 3'-5' exonuclease and polymerase domains